MDLKQRSRFGSLATALLVAGGIIASSAIAATPVAKPNVKQIIGLDGISWQTTAAYKAASLVVTGPGEFRLEQTFEAGDTLFLDFASVASKAVSASGQFKYELAFTPSVSAADKALADEARALGEDVTFLSQGAPAPISGVFTLEGGNIVDVDLPEVTLKDQVILDDLIVDGSLCVGFDCVNGESFGFDTIRMKENNIRIKAQDTSSSASFPTQDWQITFNDTSNGGANKFSIDAISPSSSTPFTIEAGSNSNALYVDDGGRIGFGTATPVVELHVKDGDTPTLRLEQDGSSGFTPQTWDVAGNEAGFFVRDATSGSTLAFRIRPGADTSSIDIGNDANIGINNSSPDTDVHLHVKGGKTFGVQVENTGGPARVNLVNGTGDQAEWQINNANGGLLRISDDETTNGGTAGTEFELDRSGNLTLSGNVITTNCPAGCGPDYVFEPDYELMPLSDLEQFIQTNKHLPNVQTAADMAANGVNMSKLSIGLLEKVEELTLYTLQQEKTIQQLSSRLEALEKD